MELRSADGPALKCEMTNVSSSGVLFRSDASLGPGDLIEYTITLPASPDTQVRLMCRGKVVRRAEDGEVAATLERWQFMRGDSGGH